jgi:hypothetical protein
MESDIEAVVLVETRGQSSAAIAGSSKHVRWASSNACGKMRSQFAMTGIARDQDSMETLLAEDN